MSGARMDRILLERAISRSQAYLLAQQAPEGYWVGELESNASITAEQLLLMRFLGSPDAARERKIANYLRERQLADGSWNVYWGGPGDLSTTIEAYFALKLAGASRKEPPMRRARDFVLSRGGPTKARVFTKIWLALFGQYGWPGIPTLPPEVIFLPHWFPVNIYDFACWARGTVVPMSIIMALQPCCPVPADADIQELYPELPDRLDYSLPRPKSWLSVKGAFLALDKLLKLYERLPIKPGRARALKKCAQWVIEHQEADGSWGGIQPPWVYSLLALKCLGYSLDHPAMARGIEGFERFATEEGDIFRLQSCMSPVWDTALTMIALLASGLSPDHPALARAARWLLKEQILTGGDWQVKRPHLAPGGWAFEFDNDLYPDIDDTAIVALALLGVQLPEQEGKEGAIERGLDWVLGMQSSNGGWGAFDVDNDRWILTQIPFADFGEMLDPPSEDVTAHILELLGRLGYGPDFPPLARGLRYLKERQEPDGAWWGRWGVNYVYGAGAVLPALAAVGEDPNLSYIRRAVDWLKAHQSPDGGWGETCATYEDPSLRGTGPSTASQTAWALMGLLAAGEGESEAVQEGVGYLLRTQEEDGSWEEAAFTGTGFPRHFLIKYHMYRNYFPLIALGHFRAFMDGRKKEPVSASSSFWQATR